jgi:hypothetical protein
MDLLGGDILTDFTAWAENLLKTGLTQREGELHCLLKSGLTDTLASLNQTFFPGT